MANSLLIGGAKLGMDFRIVSPKEPFPEESLVNSVQDYANESGATITITDDIDKGVGDVDVLYTDVWVSMGEEEHFEERITLLKPYQINMDMVKKAADDVLFLHCLPAFHNRETTMGEEIYQKYNMSAMEVTEEVFESKHSVVFDEAENRMHTIKAVMVATLGD
jgi:ornithine carbamoyltransferase